MYLEALVAIFKNKMAAILIFHVFIIILGGLKILTLYMDVKGKRMVKVYFIIPQNRIWG